MARDELGPPQLVKDDSGIKRAGWYDITIGQRTCGTLLTILERERQRIVTVQDLQSHQIWQVLDGKFPQCPRRPTDRFHALRPRRLLHARAFSDFLEDGAAPATPGVQRSLRGY